MFIAKLLLISCLVQQAYLKYTIISEIGNGTRTSSCYSSRTSLGSLLEAWDNITESIGLTSGTCKVGSLENRDCKRDIMSNYVAEVHSNLHGLGAMMHNYGDDKRVEVLNDVIPDELNPGRHNCSDLDRKPFWTEFINVARPTNKMAPMSVIPPPIVKPIPVAEPTIEKTIPFDKLLSEAEKELNQTKIRLEAERRSNAEEAAKERARMREIEDKLRKDWELERERKDAVADDLAKEIARRREIERKAHELDKMLKKKEREDLVARERVSEDMRNHVRRPNTTIAPAPTIITTLLMASAVMAGPLENRETNHLLNRPGNGAYTLSDFAESTCTLAYGSECKSWEHQLDELSFPFFHSNLDKYSMLEAATETVPILNKSSAVCTIYHPRIHRMACGREASLIKKKCGSNMSAFFYVNLAGQITVVKCDTNHVLSNDCGNCISKTLSGQKIYTPVQDMFCQKGWTESIPNTRYSKDLCSIGLHTVKECKTGTTNFERVGFIVVKGRKMYIEQMKMRSRQEFSEDQFLCYKSESSSGSSVKLKKVKVESCKGVTTSSASKCSGDEYFCSRYPCETANVEAHCILRRHSAVIEVNVNGVWVVPRCIGYEEVLVRRTSLKVEDTSSRECDTCLWECGKNKLIVKTHGPKIVYATACSHGSCKSVMQKPATFVYLPYPGNSEIVGGDIGVHMTEESSPSNIHMVAHCPAKDSCEVSSCLFCVHGLLNYQCHTLFSALLISTTVMSILTLLLLLMRGAKDLVKRLFYWLITPLCWLSVFCSWMIKSWKKRVGSAISRTNDTIGWRDNRRYGQDVERAQYTGGAPGAKYSFYGVMILGLLGNVHSCSESVLADSKIMQCTTSGSSTLCKASGTVIMKLGPIGSESCLILKGLKDSEKQFISIKTISSELTCREGESFWTTLYTPVCLSSRRCHLMGECVSDRCLKWKTNETSAEFTGKAHGEVMHENRCFEQSGGIGYGCFNVNPSCLYVHSYLKSVYKNGFKIFRCVAWNHRIRLEVTTHSRKFPMVLMAMSTQPTDWGSIGLILDSEGITGTNAYSFMKHGSGSFAIIDDPYSPEPRKGFLGEVRCPTEETAIRASPSCKMAPNLIEYQPEMDTAECTTNMIDPMAIFNRGSLPQVRDGMTFTQSIEKNTVQALTTGEVRASIRLTLDDYDVVYQNSQSDCSATFKNLTGCYSCDEGSRMCYQVKAEGETIFHFVNEDESINVINKVSPDVSDYCTVLHFSRPVISIEGRYDCGLSKRPMVIKGTLIATAPHDDRKHEGGSSLVVNPKGGTVDFFGWVSGLTSWLGGPLKTFLTILGFLALGLLLVVIIIIIARTGVQQALKKKNK
uniref:Envelopment polyprotein n=1 Tax=Toscana virus TaxID=11590 RepID=A0A0U2SZM9_TOSV|nr:glycoprotein precursor complex [Toscana virus]